MISIRFSKDILIIISLLLVGVICVGFGGINLKSAYAETVSKDLFFVSDIISFYWLILLIGGIIIITLSYVSIRKYLGQKRQKSRK